MTFRVVRTNQYNQDLGLIHSTNGNHLESPNEGSSIDHQDEEIVDKVIKETAEIEIEETEAVEPVVLETTEIETDETESRIDVSAITNYDELTSFKVLSNEEGPLVETKKEKEKEKENIIDSEDTEPLSKIPEDMMLPSVLAEEPMKIRFGHGIQIRERDWYKSSLPHIDAAEKVKASLVEKEEIRGHPAKEMFTLICADIEFFVQIREAVIEEIVSFFHSFSLRRLEVLDSVSDIAAKEEQMLQWTETDSLETTGQRRVYIVVKYREMLVRKFLEARCSNFVSGTPTSAIDLKVLDFLSDAHRIAFEKFIEQLKINKLEWTRPSSSDLFGTDIQLGGILSRLHPSVKYWVKRLILINGSWAIIEVNPSFSSSSSSSDSPMQFTVDDIPEISSSDDVPPEMQVQKAALSKELDDIRKEIQDQKAAIAHDFLEFRVESQENIHTLSAQLSEIIAYINRGGDDKKGGR
ncbi:hypothetical protein F511_24380 [Dorcoceras hygrometricum]|uniref:Splicing factor 3B subunit 1-like n=1 Tax=Dorcoceras hygrometricum TaxID=472368 RepID=A0A2Z7A8P2_9LAMI|nr:hypothetical protein F511_24380 [Dorcoceras hygrometricum]